MPINPALLVSAAMLQDYLVDKDTGLPLTNGIVTLYQDNSRTTLKNWYYQTGTPGNYTYITLPNPMTLSAVGTIVDGNGNDTIPFYYPYSETDNSTLQTYYITVQDQNLETQWVRANFPFVPNPNSGSGVSTTTNYGFNNSFWRNIGTLSLSPSTPLTQTTNVTGATLFYAIVAPGNHDGFTMPDIEYMKSANLSTEIISFQKFPSGTSPLVGDITPEYYLQHNCTAFGADGNKFYQIPISLHINQLEGQQASFTIQGISISGTANDVITPSIFQFNGTGTVQASPILLQPIELTNTWTKYTRTFTFPNTAGVPLSPGDDAWYLRLNMPSTVSFNLAFTLPSIYLSQNNLPTNSFTTYDQVDSIINSPRTADIRVSINDFYPYGWVPMNDGTIGNAVSNASTRANTDTWQLYYLLYNKFFPYTNGVNNQIIQLFNNAIPPVPVVWSGSAIADFNANNALSLTKNMARVMMGSVPIDSLISTYTTTFSGTNNGGFLFITTANTVNFYNGMPIVFSGSSLPATVNSSTVYYVGVFNGTNTFYVYPTFLDAIQHTNAIVQSTGTGTVISSMNGSQSGEYAHTQLENELAMHNHPGSTVTLYGSNVGGIVRALGSALLTTSGSSPLNIAPDGNSVPFNITQPGSFTNFYIKL